MINFKDSIIEFCSKHWRKILYYEPVNVGVIHVFYTPKKINQIHTALHQI